MPTSFERRITAPARSAKAENANLEDLLDRIVRAGAGNRVSVADVLSVAGERSFGPLLAIGGLIGASPLGVIPTLPSLLALMLGIIAAQMFVGMPRVWLPRFLLDRSIARDRLLSAVNAVRPVTRRIDHVLRPRLVPLTRGVFGRLIALACLVVVVVIPPLELLPFMATGPMIAIAAFGLAIFLRDGLLAVIALAIAGGSFVLVANALIPLIGGMLT